MTVVEDEIDDLDKPCIEAVLILAELPGTPVLRLKMAEHAFVMHARYPNDRSKVFNDAIRMAATVKPPAPIEIP